MGIGFSKTFVFIFFIALAIGYGTQNWHNTVVLLLMFAILKIVWNIMT